MQNTFWQYANFTSVSLKAHASQCSETVHVCTEVSLARSVCTATYGRIVNELPLSPSGTIKEWARNPYLDGDRKLNIFANGATHHDACTFYGSSITAYHRISLT